MDWLNVLYCITRSDAIGGAAVHVADMSQWLQSKGHNSHIIVGGEGVYCDELTRRDLSFSVSRYLRRPLRPIWDIRAVFELRAHFRQCDPDIISLHSAKAGAVGRLAAAELGIPILFTAHGWSFTEGIHRGRAALYLILERNLARLADRIITVSEYDRALAIRKRVASPEKFITIRNAMPDVSTRAHPEKTDDPVRIIVVGRLDAQKDHKTLLTALASLRDRNWVVQLVGDGPCEDRIRGMARDLKISDQVEFLGLRHDVDILLADSHIFVLPSNWEGFPRSILEAMRAGLPVIASDVGGTSESVIVDVTGFLVPRGDPKELSSRIEYLIERPGERHRLGTEARKQFERYYILDRMAEATLDVYKSTLGGYPCESA